MLPGLGIQWRGPTSICSFKSGLTADAKIPCGPFCFVCLAPTQDGEQTDNEKKG